MKKALLIMALTLSSSPVLAHHGVHLENCVIQAPIAGKNMTGAFLKFNNHGESVTITKVDVPSITAQAELHSMTMKDNIMTMTPLSDLTISGERLFRKGGDHVMLMQIPKEKIPKAGETHKMTFSFSDGSTASCEAIVKTPEEVIQEAKSSASKHHQH